jgi:uncharacterized repeat protein (TIGR03803 family)
MRRRSVFVVVSLLLGCQCVVCAQTLTTLWQFGSLSNDADGGNSWSGLIQASDGNFYGTSGGTNTVHCTVFKITPEGTLTTLWQFGSLSNNADGNSPIGGLVQGSDGDFYGTTSNGGTNLYFGTVFKITSDGTLTPLWQFTGGVDGGGPLAGLVQGSDGNFYGTTFGAYQLNHPNSGTVFKITPAGTLTPLWQFTGGADGGAPNCRLVQGNDGNFYGTTVRGGTNDAGTVFKITSEGTLTTIWQFRGLSNNADGYYPEAGLIQGSDGNFYGSTTFGGTNKYHGALFKIASAGTLTPLWQFGSLSNQADGNTSNPLLQGSDGNLYGTGSGVGSVFRITPAGALTQMWAFSSVSNFLDGEVPIGGLIQGSDGCLYGTTRDGGNHGNRGTIFKLTVPLNPPANQISSVCVADTNVVVAIPSVAGETYQLQYSADLASGNWSNVDGACVTKSLGAMLTFTNFGGASSPQGFYRFDITP